MKFLLIFFTFSSIFVVNFTKDVKCESEGCFEVIKVFAELLERKINATDAILAEVENELNQISFGNDEKFKATIKEVDAKLLKLIDEINTGVDGGDKTLFELINSVFDDVSQVEKLADEVDIEGLAASKNVEANSNNLDDTQEVIRQIQDELSKLLNATTVDGPEALQDAFDRSEKFNSNSSQLKNILEEVKLILKDYEENLINAKTLTTLAIAKFTNVSSQADEAITQQKEVDHKLSETDDLKLSEDELKNLEKLVKDASEESKRVFEQAFDLLNEVTEFELNNKLSEINEKVEKLNKHSDATTMNLKDFVDENAKFLIEMEATIDAAEVAEKKAFKIQREIEELLETIKNIHADAMKAIADQDSIIDNARSILYQLEDFASKVEKSRENARFALEKIPQILKKIEDSVKIVDTLEKKLDSDTKAATETKEKCSTAKEQMDKILGESDDIRAKIKQLEIDFESFPEDIKTSDKDATKISDEIDKLERSEAEDNKLIELTKIKIEKTKSQAHKTDVEVDKALKNIQNLIDGISQVKNIDQESLDDFEAKLNEAEKELDESHLNHNLKDLKARRQAQLELVERYRVDISYLEYQLSVIKNNAESLEHRCFKRTRLEP